MDVSFVQFEGFGVWERDGIAMVAVCVRIREEWCQGMKIWSDFQYWFVFRAGLWCRWAVQVRGGTVT